VAGLGDSQEGDGVAAEGCSAGAGVAPGGGAQVGTVVPGVSAAAVAGGAEGATQVVPLGVPEAAAAAAPGGSGLGAPAETEPVDAGGIEAALVRRLRPQRRTRKTMPMNNTSVTRTVATVLPVSGSIKGRASLLTYRNARAIRGRRTAVPVLKYGSSGSKVKQPSTGSRRVRGSQLLGGDVALHLQPAAGDAGDGQVQLEDVGARL